MTDREIHEEREREKTNEEIKTSLVLVFVSPLLVDLEYDRVERRTQKSETTFNTLRELRVLARFK